MVFRFGKLSVTFKDDFPFGDQGDKFRTAAFMGSYQVNDRTSIVAGFSIFTGKGTEIYENSKKERYYSKEEPYAYRNGPLYGGLIYNGRAYLAGWNSEGIRAAIQNNFHDIIGSPHFLRMDQVNSGEYLARPYSYFGILPAYALPY